MINETMNEALGEAESKTPDARVFWSGDLFGSVWISLYLPHRCKQQAGKKNPNEETNE